MATEKLDLAAIFNVARRIAPPDARQQYLAQVCGGDRQLQAQIEALLRVEDEDRSFLESPAAELAMTSDLGGLESIGRGTESIGSAIGPYKLLQKIGEGGFGVVFMAEQERPVRRRVALKIIKPGMDTKEVIARFEHERQAIAMMEHPNIARVFDAGATESGRPFFVMELVHGVPITEFCDKNHMPADKRLKLFVEVCHAVQHAHHKGIIHRDIKPSNVMVTLHDGVPIVKVIDFGVAKATAQKLTERTLFTAYGQMIGTPAYMSPEQAEMSGLDIDVRSDIYSLGVLLYELLTGTTPLETVRLRKAGYAEMQRMIREEEPPRPSTRITSLGDSATVLADNRGTDVRRLAQLLRGDLDWIVMKALEKDRNRRYPSPGNFALDIQRFLNSEAIEARPPSAAYRLSKFAQRNKAGVVSAGLVLSAVVLGMVGTIWGRIQAERRRSEAEHARIEEAEQRKLAEQAEDDMLADYRASADDAIAQLIGSKPGLGQQERAYLERSLKRWQSFAARHGDNERAMRIRAEGHFRVGVLWSRLGRRDEARTEYEQALELYEKLTAQFPAVRDYVEQLAMTHNNLGELCRNLGQNDEAHADHERARAIRQRLTEQFPDEPAYQRQLAISHYNLAALLVQIGKPVEARDEYNQARSLQQDLVDRFPDIPDYQRELASTHSSIGSLLEDNREPNSALIEHEQAQKIRKTLASRFHDVADCRLELAQSHNNLAIVLKDLRRFDEAQTEYDRALHIYQELTAQFPSVPDYAMHLGGTHCGIL